MEQQVNQLSWKVQQNPKELDLSYCVFLQDIEFITYLKSPQAKQMQSLNLSHTLLSDASLLQLSFLHSKSLKFLNLSYCVNFTEGAIVNLLNSETIVNIEVLDLSGNQLSDVCLKFVLQPNKMKYLASIVLNDIKKGQQGFSYKLFEILSQTNLNKSLLNLSVGNSFVQPDQLQMTKAQTIMNTFFNRIMKEDHTYFYQLSLKSTSIQTLTLFKCELLTNKFIKMLCRNIIFLSSIKVLNIGHCKLLTDKICYYLSEAGASNYWVQNITPDGLDKIIKSKSLKLSHLGLAMCEDIQQDAIRTLMGSKFGKTLTSLEVSGSYSSISQIVGMYSWEQIIWKDFNLKTLYIELFLLLLAISYTGLYVDRMSQLVINNYAELLSKFHTLQILVNLYQLILQKHTIVKICLPKNPDYLNEIKEFIVRSFNQQIGSGLRDLKWIILEISLVSVIISVIVILFIEKYSTRIFWGYFIIIVFSLFSLCLLSAQQYYQSQEQLQLNQQLEANKIIQFANSLQISQKLYQIGITIIAVTLSIIYAIYLKSQTTLLNLFIKVGGDFIKSNITCIIAPIVGAAIIILYSFIWIEQQLYLLSNLKIQDNKYSYFQLNLTSEDQVMIFINFFIYIWTLVFIIGLIEYLTSGMVCEWYYQQGNRMNFEKKNILLKLIQNHIGSIALGSMLITIFKFIKQILNTTKICQGFQNRIILAISKHNYVIKNIQPNHFLDCGIIVRELIIKEIDTYNKIRELGQTFLGISRLIMALFCQSICMFVIQDHPYSIILSLYCFVIAFSIISLYGQSSEAIYMLYLYSQKHLSLEDNPQCTITLQLVFNYLNDNINQMQ